MEKTEMVCQPTTPRRISRLFRAGGFEFPLGRRTYVMGILNVTPDSFSDGGCYLSLEQAVDHAREMLADGADIIDVGGESTRPGYEPVSAEIEMDRVLPVIRKIHRELGCPISIDTYKSDVAEAALLEGACIINDINGLQIDAAMADVAARYRSGIILMHNARIYRGSDSALSPDDDVIDNVKSFLRKSIRIAEQAGVQSENMMVDPGIGFGETVAESLAMIDRLDELREFGLPVLLGPSRKRFIGRVLGQTATNRLIGTCAVVAMGIARGVDFVRVHDTKEVAETVLMADAIERSGGNGRWRTS
ncbi:MAG: dihydropteroate synthase [Saccharofermentanales bacterium]|jgi:dihydropteroate synthase